jgi:hypothetical protein
MGVHKQRDFQSDDLRISHETSLTTTLYRFGAARRSSSRNRMHLAKYWLISFEEKFDTNETAVRPYFAKYPSEENL